MASGKCRLKIAESEEGIVYRINGRALEMMNPSRMLNILQDRRIELILLFLLSLAVYIHYYFPIQSWVVSHWLFDYQHGFTKRSLPGELLRLSVSEITYRQIELISFALGAILSLQLACFAFVIYRKFGNPLVPIGLLIIPSSIANIAWDSGRFDTINYLIAFSFLLLPRRAHSLSLASGLCILMLLIHEAAFFVQAPLIWVAASFHRKSLNYARMLFLMCISIISLLSILMFSHMDITADEFLSYILGKIQLAEYMKPPLEGYYVLSISFSDNLREVIDLLFSIKGVIGLSFISLFAVFWYNLSRWITKKQPDFGNRSVSVALFFAGISPLLLMFTGIDWYRWCSLLTINAIAMTAFLLKENSNDKEERNSLSILLFCIFIITFSQFPGVTVGNLPDGLQCLAADYDLVHSPARTRCPSEAFVTFSGSHANGP